MTTKLIQELVGLCVEKKLNFCYSETLGKVMASGVVTIEINSPNAPQQLQAAIDKVKQL
jgi:hypothetical protein